jgi:uncharacterized membrane protein
MQTRRLELFSDAVFAIAITLLVLEIGVPEPGSGDLAHQLGEQWPQYASYVVSFLTIGVIWINHHAVCDHLVRADRVTLMLNLLLLCFVALIPWPTHLLAEYMLEEGTGERVAALVYSGTMAAMSLAFAALWRHATHDRRLIDDQLSDAELRSRTRRFQLGAPGYALAAAVALLSAPACLAINAALAVFYVLPGGGLLDRPPADR